MSEIQDAELTQELEALVAAKEHKQSVMRTWFAGTTIGVALALMLRHHTWVALALFALAIAALVQGVRAHLRANALRNQAMEKILAEAFRRAAQDTPKVDA